VTSAARSPEAETAGGGSRKLVVGVNGGLGPWGCASSGGAGGRALLPPLGDLGAKPPRS